MINKTMKTKQLPLKLDIQFFAEENTGEGGATNTETTKTETTETKTDPAGTGSKTTETKEEKETTFTQEQMSKVAAAEAKKARDKVLKDLGIEDVTKGKEALKAYKESVDAQKTAAQLAVERAEALEKDKLAASNEVTTLKSQLAAMKADVKADSVEDVVVLASKYMDDETDIDAAIVKVLEKYPQFKRDEVVTDTKEKPNFLNTDHKTGDKPTDQDIWNKSFAVEKLN